jgi:hypothetical protein
LISSVTWFRSRQAIMISPNNLEALAERPAFTRYDPSSGTGWITLAREKKRRAFRVRGDPRISEEADAFAVSFTREVPNLVRQQNRVLRAALRRSRRLLPLAGAEGH